jgi:glycosyltransferase involved in cell wall biosynthesis
LAADFLSTVNFFAKLTTIRNPLPERNKKVLIITYYWPPSGGSGVQRWLKFVKYLPAFGWEPYVFTPENPAFDIKDESLLKDVPEEAEVIRFPIWEPYHVFFRISAVLGSRKSAKPTELISGKKGSLFQSISTWIRANLVIPDPRVFWVKPSIKFLEDFLAANKIQTIITTGPPHSLHLIGLGLKKKNPALRWIADFRDPWSEWGFLDSLNIGTRARQKHKRLESKVLCSADEVITITPFYVRKFEALSKRKVHLLTNGYDEDDFSNLEYTRSEKFVIRHIGIINEKCDPRPFEKALGQLMEENTEVARHTQLHFIGEVHPSFRAFAEHSSLIKDVTVFAGNIPHKNLLPLYGSSSLLLFILTGYKDAEGYMPGKLFEYLATGLPVLGIGPVNGDASGLLKATQAGEMIDSSDVAGIKKSLLMHFQYWLDGRKPGRKTEEVKKYSRREIASALDKILLR